MKPGIIGPSQIDGRDEVEKYPEGCEDTEQYYIEHILPEKLTRDIDYVRNASLRERCRIPDRRVSGRSSSSSSSEVLRERRGRGWRCSAWTWG